MKGVGQGDQKSAKSVTYHLNGPSTHVLKACGNTALN